MVLMKPATAAARAGLTWLAVHVVVVGGFLVVFGSMQRVKVRS